MNYDFYMSKYTHKYVYQEPEQEPYFNVWVVFMQYVTIMVAINAIPVFGFIVYKATLTPEPNPPAKVVNR